MNRFIVSIAAVGMTVSFSTVAHGAFVSPNSWARGEVNTTYQAWDVFAGFTNVIPDVVDQNSHGSAVLSELSGASFVTGSGNLYSPALPLSVEVSIPVGDIAVPQHDLTAVVQIQTLGTELDAAGITLNQQSPVDSAELTRNQLGGFGGAEVEHWFLFELPYSDFGSGASGSTSLTLQFGAAGSSMSLGRLAVDTAISSEGFLLEEHPLVASAIPGDITLDQQVDIGDLAVLAQHFRMTGAKWTQGDLTGDTVVDIGDLAVLAQHFGSAATASPELTAAVPEPGLIGALALPGWFLLHRRQRMAAS